MRRRALTALIVLGMAACEPADLPWGGGADARFVARAASLCRLEMRLATDAGARAASADVREFAARRVAEWRRMYRSLQRVAERAEVGLPDDLLAEHQQVYAVVAGLREAEFDRAYVKAVAAGEEASIEALRAEVAHAHRSAVVMWAADALPELEQQLAETRALAQQTLVFAELPAER